MYSPHIFRCGGVVVCHPFACLFQDQVQHLQHLHKSFINGTMTATQTQHSFPKIVLLFAYFFAYFESEGHTPQYPTLIFLSKSQAHIEQAIRAIQIVRQVRTKASLPRSTRVVRFSCEETMCQEEEAVPVPTIVLATIRSYIMAALYRSLYTSDNRAILYISECDTLDLECQEIFAKDISWLSIYHAMAERDYLHMRYLPVDEDFDGELKSMERNLKDPNSVLDEVSFLSDDRKLLGLIRYVLCFFKYRHKQQEIHKKRMVVSRKITEFVVNELEGELFLKSDLLLSLRKYFLKFLANHNIEERTVKKLLGVCEFLETIVIVRRDFQSEHKNAFRIFSNCRSQHDNYTYRLACVDPRIMFYRIYPLPSRLNGVKEQTPELPKVLLVLNSYSCLQKDFFYSHFKLQVSIKTFVQKLIAAQNILSMSVVCNAFDVDLKSDDYESDNKLQIQRSYGTLIEELAEAIPDGIIVFISSYRYLLTLIEEWTKEKILDKVRGSKMIFFEVENEKQNQLNLELFRKSCDFGRGGIFFINVRSKALEAAEFKGHYSNLVIFLGYPVISEVEAHTKEKLDYLNEKQKAKEYDYLEQDAMRHVNKWMVGLLGDSRRERKIMLFADARYSMTMIPAWMSVADGNLSISTAIEKCKEFARKDTTEVIESLIRASQYRK